MTRPSAPAVITAAILLPAGIGLLLAARAARDWLPAAGYGALGIVLTTIGVVLTILLWHVPGEDDLTAVADATRETPRIDKEVADFAAELEHW